jgi:tRNA-splicing ligase RtcB
MDATVFTPDGMEPDAKAVEQLATRAPHGAGRVMSRTKAAGKWKEGRGRAYAAGRLDRHQGRSACAPLGVLTAHPNIEIVHRLRPLGVFMAGDDIVDPYKD